jgi:LPXTG-motif cell wall-anchored protein
MIWLLPAASLGRGVDGALKSATEQLGESVGQTVAPVQRSLRATTQKTKAALDKTRAALERAKREAAEKAAAAGTRVASPDPSRQPPQHGGNPHGQGGVAVVDLNPSAERPLGANPDGSDSGPEDVVVGRARGEQAADGSFHGHITIVALFGRELSGVNTAPGETKNGPLQPIQEGILDPLCTATSDQVCLSVLTADSQTTGTGSRNDFAVARARILGLGANAAESGGTIGQTADCQTSVGSSSAANVTSSSGAIAQAANSVGTSNSCRGQNPQVTRDSRVIGLGGVSVPLPAAGCDNGTADTVTDLPPLARIVCNADDLAGAAVVRDALDVFVLNSGTTSLVRESTASSEAVSVAPKGPEATGPQCSDGVDNDGDGKVDGADPGCHSDGDAGNPASFVPSDTDETDAKPTGPSGEPEDGGTPECSDNRDNDGDGKVDEDDPGCHSDGNPNNASSYNPDDDNESNGAGAPDAGAGDAGTVPDDTLPFTGANIVGLALAGLLMLAGGLLLRRREDALGSR